MKSSTIRSPKAAARMLGMLSAAALGCGCLHAATILIDYDDGVAGGGHDSAIRNGGFESGSDPDGDANFLGVDNWINMRGLENVQATINTQVATGSRAAIMNGNQSLYALETGHTIQLGDQFSGSFDWRTALNSEVDDVMRITLFFTADNTLPITATVGDATDFYSFTANNATALNTYETASWSSGIVGLGDAAIGKSLMFRFESLGTTVPAPFEFGRVDNVFLQVIPEPGAALLGGLGLLALLRRRR
jgi:hypothetical protein